MSYQVIARKYRPQRFEDVVGQEHVTQTLANAIQQNRIAHAYLFVGPRGTGKTTVARIFAKCLNCTDGPKTSFQDSDPRVIEITEGRSLDVLEIDGASNRGIDEVRELRDTVKYAPASSRFKIYIIDEVHMLTKEAFNALLKTLEEPPPHAKFMFATTEPDKVLPTILSRCQRFDLRRIPSALIVKQLAAIAAKEGVQIDPAALHAVARGADGGMRDAESTLDQLISFCGSQIAESDVLSMFGLAAESQIFDLTNAILSGEVEPALRLLNDLARQGKELSRIVTELLNHFRNLLIHQVSHGDLSLIEASEAEAAMLTRQASLTTSDAVTRMMEILTDCEGRLRETTSKKILVEVTLLKLIDARNAISLDTVLKQLQELRSQAGPAPKTPSRKTAVTPHPAPAVPQASPVPVPASVPTPTPVPAPVPAQVPVTALAPAPTPTTQSLDAVKPETPIQPTSTTAENVDMQSLWAGLTERITASSPFVSTYLAEAHPVSIERNILTIGFSPDVEDHITLIDNSKNQTLLKETLAAMGFNVAGVRFIKHGTAPAKPAPTRLPDPEPVMSSAASLPRVNGKATPTHAHAQQSPAPAAPSASVTAAPLGGTASASTPTTPAAPATPTPMLEPVPFDKDTFKNDPLIRKALETFKGQIIDVRSQST
jgi:DNA polymerase-3 subunit gamma/tau